MYILKLGLDLRVLVLVMAAAAAEKPTLVLDLDNTLVFGRATKRPGLDEFLERVNNIVVFTAANKERADRIVDHILNAKKKYVGHCLYNDSCVQGAKPLTVLGKDLKRVVAIDDNPATFACNEENGLSIPPFSSFTLEQEEREKPLLKLVPLLEEIAPLVDLRPSLREWKNENPWPWPIRAAKSY